MKNERKDDTAASWEPTPVKFTDLEIPPVVFAVNYHIAKLQAKAPPKRPDMLRLRQADLAAQAAFLADIKTGFYSCSTEGESVPLSGSAAIGAVEGIAAVLARVSAANGENGFHPVARQTFAAVLEGALAKIHKAAPSEVHEFLGLHVVDGVVGPINVVARAKDS